MSVLNCVQTQLLTLAAASALSGCATGYHAAKNGGRGYFDQKIEGDRFVVGFKANSFTPAKRVEKFTLRRAAELTLASGNRYFMFLDEKPARGRAFQAFREQPAEPSSKVYDAERIKADTNEQLAYH